MPQPDQLFPPLAPAAGRRSGRQVVALTTAATLTLLGLLTGVAPTASAAVTAGTVTAWGEPPSADVPASLAVTGATSISAGGYLGLAVTPAGKVVTWGYSDHGSGDVPSSLDGRRVTAVAGGAYHNLALTSDGHVTAWGFDDEGQTDVPESLDETTVTAIAAGTSHSLALTDDGHVVGWGENSSGETTTPASLDDKTVVAIAAGGHQSLALTADGEIVGWGNNDFGQLTVPASLQGKKVVAISEGFIHSLALTDDGTITAWGNDGSGETDLPESLDGKTVTAISAGGNHNLALTDDGTVIGWGYNASGQATPPASLVGQKVTAIAAGVTISVALTQGVAPSVTSAPASTKVEVGGIASFTAAATGTPTPDVRWQRASRPEDDFTDIPDATSATYTFDAVAADSGARFRAVFTNPNGSATSDAATLAVNSTPTVKDVEVDAGYEADTPVNLAGTDADGDELTYTVVDEPQHGELSGEGPTLTYTPDEGFSGDDGFTYTAKDETVTSDVATVSITVAPEPNEAPVAKDVNRTTEFETPTQITLSATDADGDELTYTVVAAPGHGQLSGDGATRTYTPDAGFDGNDSFTYLANDGDVDSALATVSIIVKARPNTRPEATDLTIAAAYQTATPATLKGTDADGDALTYAVTEQPDHGTLSGTEPALTYTPDDGYHGPDAFTYTVDDGTDASAAATATITVGTKPNTPPAAADVAVTAGFESATSVALNGTDPDSDPLTYAVVTQPTHGTLTGGAPALTYTPADGYSGPDSFTYRVNDGVVDSSVATVALTVTSQSCVPAMPTREFSVDVDQRDGDGKVHTAKFSTKKAGELLLAHVTLNGPSPGTQSVHGVTGGGLTWTLVQRDNTLAGTSEVWQAYAPAKIKSTSVEATLAAKGYSVTMTVAGFSGARPTVGSSAHRSGTASVPQVTLTPQASGSVVWAVGRVVGSRYDPKPVSGQKVVHDETFTSPSTGYWVQRTTAATQAGAPVTVADKATAKSWGYTAVEIRGVCG